MSDEERRRAKYEENGSDASDWGPATRPGSGRRARLATMVSVRFSPEEAARVRAAAVADGTTVSAYIRAAALVRSTPATDRCQVLVTRARTAQWPTSERLGLTFIQAPADLGDSGAFGITTIAAIA